MTKPRNTKKSGAALEARTQRLFMCQSVFAERNLFVRALGQGSNLVTDIDVLAHDCNTNLRDRKIYVECKSGGSVRPFDRIIWTCGIKKAVNAEVAYLVLDKCDTGTVSFARDHGVEILQTVGLVALEESLGVGPGFWPGRTNLHAYSDIEAAVSATVRERGGEDFGRWLSRALYCWREASAMTFSYGRLNALVSVMSEIEKFANAGLSETDKPVLSYAARSLLVRLGQYALHVTWDTLNMTKQERQEHILEKLTVGDTGLEQSRRILQACKKMIDVSLKEHGAAGDTSWNLEHILRPPSYALAFVNMIERTIVEGYRSRLLPLVLELSLFGFRGSATESAGLVNCVEQNINLAGIVKGFAAQTLGIPDTVVTSPLADAKGVGGIQSSLFKEGDAAGGPRRSMAED